MWFKDESGGSWWTCNTANESHQNERDSEVLQVWDCTVEDDLKELIGTTYANKMILLFSCLSLKKSTGNCVWFWVVMG